MGASNVKQRKGYSDSEYDEEIELRKFEEEMGAFRKSLMDVLPRICIEKDIIPIKTLEDHIRKEFSENFVLLLRQGYFHKDIGGKQYYDARKINLLFFLLTNDSVIDNGRTKYHNKASFLFTLVKTREDQNLCESIEENEEMFINFITSLVDIASDGIVDCYNRLKNVKRDGYLNKMKSVKENMITAIITHLFTNVKNQKIVGLSFDDVDKKFAVDRYIFTAGWVREFGWKILAGGKGDELDKEEKEKEKEKE